MTNGKLERDAEIPPFAPTTDAERASVQKDLHDMMRKRLTPEDEIDLGWP